MPALWDPTELAMCISGGLWSHWLQRVMLVAGACSACRINQEGGSKALLPQHLSWYAWRAVYCHMSTLLRATLLCDD